MENKTFYENEQGWINPILGADSVTNKGTQIWQDDREYAQSLLYQITDESGKAIVSWTENLTDIYGNVTEIARNYKIGKYKVEAKHDWDRYYTDVSNTAEFEVVPVILNITKTANVTEVGNNTLVKFTIKVNNMIRLMERLQLLVQMVRLLLGLLMSCLDLLSLMLLLELPLLVI